MLDAACLGKTEALTVFQPIAARGASLPKQVDIRRYLRALSVTAAIQNPRWLWSDVEFRGRQFRRRDTGNDISIAILDGQWLLRDRETIAAAKANKDQANDPTWSEISNRMVREGDTLLVGRLLLDQRLYDIEAMADDYRERVIANGGRVSKIDAMDVRSATITAFQVPNKFYFHPALGFDTKPIDV